MDTASDLLIANLGMESFTAGIYSTFSDGQRHLAFY